MGMKPRTPRLRMALTEEEAREIHDRLCHQWVGYGPTRAFVEKLGSWLNSK